MNDVVDRALGAFSMSVGTASSIARLIEPEGNPRRKEGMEHYDALYVSLHTLVRNAQASMNSANQATTMPVTVANFVLEDLMHLTNVARDVGLPIILYLYGDSDLRRKYPIGNHRLPSTDKQLFAQDYRDSVVASVIKSLNASIKDKDSFPNLKIQHTTKLEINVDKKYKKPIILTSNAIDLLESGIETSVQSYTAAILEKHQYWLLFNKSSRLRERDFSRIPFNRLFIQIFGDAKSFYSRGYKELERILDLAEKRDWNQATTKDRIRMTMTQEGLWKEDYDNVVF